MEESLSAVAIAPPDVPARDGPPRLAHIGALDGLRGAAVAGVLLFHAGHLTGGYLGVDAFFVLSGYLITSLLVTEWSATESVNLGRFWARRARRLIPALFLALLGVAFYAALFAKATDLGRIRGDAFATIAYVANWRSIFAEHSYWDLFSAPSPLEHTWSLAIEEQFYLLWPLVALFVLRRSKGSVGWLAVTALTISAASAALLVLAFGPDQQSRAYLGTDTRVAAILLGAALACWQVRSGHARGITSRWVLEAVGIAAVAYLVWAWTSLSGNDPFLYHGGLYLAGIAVTVVIAAITHPVRGPLRRALELAPLCLLGLISYGVYLWHWPVYLVLTAGRTGLDPLPLFVVRVGVSVAIATVSFVLVERPIRRGQFSGRRLIALSPVALAAVGVAVVVGTVGAQSPNLGFAEGAGRPSIPTDETWTAGERLAPLTNRCTEGWLPEPVDPATAASTETKVLVVGDSVACFIGASFEMHQNTLGIAALNRSIVGCPFVRSEGGRIRYSDGSTSEQRAGCRDSWAGDLDEFDPDVVVVLIGYSGIYDWRVEDEWRHPCDPVFDEWWQAGARRNLELLTSTGAAVALTTVVHQPKAVDELPGPDPAELRRRTDCFNEQLRHAAAQVPGVEIVDLDGFVCPGGECRERIDGVTMRTDPIHFTGRAADVVTRWLMARILEVAGKS
jgi:peptidoglycan/LPS O-acetylase OafA/YrhL